MPRRLLLAGLALGSLVAIAFSATSHQCGRVAPQFDPSSERFTVVFAPDTQYLPDEARGTPSLSPTPSTGSSATAAPRASRSWRRSAT